MIVLRRRCHPAVSATMCTLWRLLPVALIMTTVLPDGRSRLVRGVCSEISISMFTTSCLPRSPPWSGIGARPLPELGDK